MKPSTIIADCGLTFSSSRCEYPRTIAVLRNSALTGFEIPCRLLRCSGCGDVRLNRATVGVWETALLGECIYRGVVADTDREALQKRVMRRKYLIRLFPTADHTSRFFTTDPREGNLVHPSDLPLMLVEAWQTMVDARKPCGGSRGWTAPTIPKSMPRDQKCLGISMQPIEMQAETLKSYYGDRLQISFSDGRWSVILPPDLSPDVLRRQLGFRAAEDRVPYLP